MRRGCRYVSKGGRREGTGKGRDVERIGRRAGEEGSKYISKGRGERKEGRGRRGKRKEGVRRKRKRKRKKGGVKRQTPKR